MAVENDAEEPTGDVTIAKPATVKSAKRVTSAKKAAPAKAAKPTTRTFERTRRDGVVAVVRVDIATGKETVTVKK